MERKLRYLEKEIKKDNIPVTDTGENPEAPQPREMIDLEVRIICLNTLLVLQLLPSPYHSLYLCISFLGYFWEAREWAARS